MSLEQQLERQHVGRRKIGHMDVVADRRPVGRVVIVAEHGEVRHVTLQRHHRAGNEVGFDLAQFADAAGRIGAAALK